MFSVSAAHGILGGTAGEVSSFLQRLRATRVTIDAGVCATETAKSVTDCGFSGGASGGSRQQYCLGNGFCLRFAGVRLIVAAVARRAAVLSVRAADSIGDRAAGVLTAPQLAACVASVTQRSVRASLASDESREEHQYACSKDHFVRLQH